MDGYDHIKLSLWCDIVLIDQTSGERTLFCPVLHSTYFIVLSYEY